MTDTQQYIGTLLPESIQRDAIHIAVLPVVVGEDLWASAPVKIDPETGHAVLTVLADSLGILDPFLKASPNKGERVFLFLHPNTITGLRHHWTHPAVAEPTVVTLRPGEILTVGNQAKIHAEGWLVGFAKKWGFDYDDMIRVATEAAAVDVCCAADDYYLVAHDRDLHGADDLGADHDLFWEHLSTLTGRTYSPAQRTNLGWSCAC